MNLWTAGAIAAGIAAGAVGAIAGYRALNRAASGVGTKQSGSEPFNRNARRMSRGSKNTLAEVVSMECGFCGWDKR